MVDVFCKWVSVVRWWPNFCREFGGAYVGDERAGRQPRRRRHLVALGLLVSCHLGRQPAPEVDIHCSRQAALPSAASCIFPSRQPSIKSIIAPSKHAELSVRYAVCCISHPLMSYYSSCYKAKIYVHLHYSHIHTKSFFSWSA